MNKSFPRRFHGRIRNRLCVVAVYALLAVWSTWPLARHPASRLPARPAGLATVPLLNVWTIWWNSDRLRHGLRGYWDAPIFHPTGESFAFSEPQPTTMLAAPVIWLTGSRVLAYNLYLWLSLILNALFAERLLNRLGVRRSAAFFGGAAMLLLPIVHWQRHVLQLVPLWGILWTWTAWVKTSKRPTLSRGAELGAAFGVTFLTCAHHGLFLGILLVGAIWLLWERLLRARTWMAFVSGAVVAGAIVGPVAWQFAHVFAEHAFTRPPELVANLSAMPGDYTAASGRPLIDLGDLAARPGWRLSPGWVKAGLAMLGLAIGLRRRKWRRTTTFLLVTAVLAFLLSLGSNLHVGPWQPWTTLRQLVPGLGQVRNVFRFAFFVQMASVLLAAQGLHALLLSGRLLPVPRRWRTATGALVLGLGFVALVEVCPSRPKLISVPDADAHSGWIEFVRAQTPAGRGIACIPFAQGDRSSDFETTTRWMYLGTFHGAPMVNGYSGFFPSDYFDVRSAVNRAVKRGSISEACLRKLTERHVEFLVVNRAEVPAGAFGEARFDSIVLRHVFGDPVGIDVYRLQSAGR